MGHFFESVDTLDFITGAPALESKQ